MGCGASRASHAVSPADNHQTLGNAAALAHAWRSDVTCSSSTDGVYGRLACVRPDSDLATVTIASASRRVVFVADGSSWAGRNFRRGARDILLRNGVEAAWIDGELSHGTRFKLVLFDDDGTVWPADWEGVQRAVAVYHPKVVAKIAKHWDAVRNTSWEELEGASGQSFAELEPMTEERYLEAEDTPAAARWFLASTLSLNKLFLGTGYTSDGHSKDASDASPEFFAANRPLKAVHPSQIIDLDP
eukprot:744287-Rhodomonas_salina.1